MATKKPARRNMDKLDVAERLAVASSIATLNAESKNTQNSISALAGEVRAGNAQSSQQNTEILKCIAVLTSKSDDSVKYQDECDKDRKQIRDETRADIEKLEKRVSGNDLKINTIQTRSITLSGYVAGGIGLFGMVATWAGVWATLKALHQ